MTPYLTNDDPGDESDAPPVVTVCLMCRGQRVLYTRTSKAGWLTCPTCKGTGAVEA
jgi:hypothetical protein